VNVTFEERGRYLVGTLIVRTLDVTNCRPFKDFVAGTLGEQKRELILDLASLEEIDSAGLGALVAILKWVRRYEGTMRISGMRPQVRDVFELTMLHRIFPVNATVEEALAEARAPRIAYAD
jgi:anti-sigma B factor antagonist